MLDERMKPALEMGLPATLVSCAKDGTPNVTYLSKIYWLDDEHLAVSFQFFSKTIRNVRENPRVAMNVTDPANMGEWNIDMEYVRSETEGAMFDEMDMAIEAIASMTGMAGVFKLKAADVYKVHSAELRPFAVAPADS